MTLVLRKKALASQSLKLIHVLKEACEFALVLDPLPTVFIPGLLVFRISVDLARCASVQVSLGNCRGWRGFGRKGKGILCDVNLDFGGPRS